MYRPVVRLNTNICKVCKRVFNSEKSLKDHIFNRRVNDINHIKFKGEISFSDISEAIKGRGIIHKYKTTI